PAVGGHRVAGVGLGVRVGDVLPHRQAARVGVLDDRHGRCVAVVMGGAPGGVGVHIVVVAHRLAVQLLGAGEPGGPVPVPVQGSLLVRVLAVAQHLGAVPGGTDPSGEAGAVVGGHHVADPGGHVHVVGGGVPERLSGQGLALVEGEPAGAHRVSHLVIAAGTDHHGHARVVLRRGAHHRRPADVDLLDALVLAGAGGDRVGEWVEVDDHQVERRHLELLELFPVGVQAAVGEDAGVDARVQGLHPTVQALGELGDLLHRGDRYARVGDHARSGTGGDE